jgi:hypothetical protein
VTRPCTSIVLLAVADADPICNGGDGGSKVCVFVHVALPMTAPLHLQTTDPPPEQLPFRQLLQLPSALHGPSNATAAPVNSTALPSSSALKPVFKILLLVCVLIDPPMLLGFRDFADDLSASTA